MASQQLLPRMIGMHGELLQEGLLRRDKKAAGFVTIGEPEIRVRPARFTSRNEMTPEAAVRAKTEELLGVAGWTRGGSTRPRIPRVA